ncbi:type II secretion system pilot lipoprotein GspS-beta [uncultured Photobacterium sp.]|uniref:type II secretion system pilot lipoprotein GspS-beta n=1 Tax=uncultured Photobacterium sp. TaxID=173973 RepID=UPI00260F1C28|nr:type II secretion system pilot lipoprotein GspS-beta [uncultured Photobacterium sp.]
MNLTTTKKWLVAAVCLFILGGCASHDQQMVAESLAQSRAAAIGNKAPYPQIDAYQITQAYASKNTVKINIIYGGNGRVKPTTAIKTASVNYCNNNELMPLFKQGVNYLITIRDVSGRQLVSQTISEEYCESLK